MSYLRGIDLNLNIGSAWLVFLASLVAFTACGGAGQNAPGMPAPVTLRVGYFPNITHATALIGLSRGIFQEALGPDVKIEQKVFNAGPPVIEALFAGAIDISYIGPGPAVTGYVRSDGEAVRIVAGAASGGAFFVVRKDSGIHSAKDLAGKKIATPQIGNTQDIALRSYLLHNGLKPTEVGGSVQVTPVNNPDILTLFQKKEIDGAWAPEPWATRLVREADGRIFIDERDLWPQGRFATTVVIVRTKFLQENPELVKRFLIGHVKSTEWTNGHQEESQTIFNQELTRIQTQGLPLEVVQQAWSSLEFSTDILEQSITGPAQQAFELGFLGTKPLNLKNLIDSKPLQDALQASKSLGTTAGDQGGTR